MLGIRNLGCLKHVGRFLHVGKAEIDATKYFTRKTMFRDLTHIFNKTGWHVNVIHEINIHFDISIIAANSWITP